jgi:excisionase family DNA binding protein
VADLLLSSRNVELAACALDYLFRRDGGAPNDETRQLAAALAIAVPQRAARLPGLLAAIGPQAAAAVKAQARRIAASRFDDESAGSASSVTVTLSVSEAARIAGVSRQAIRAAAAAGRLVATKDLTGAWRITTTALHEWLEERHK